MDFSTTLKSLRLSRNLTQEMLADQVGVSTVALQGWERGTRKPSFDALVCLCTALNVSLDELAGTKPLTQAERPVSRSEKNLLDGYRKLDRHGQRLLDVVCREELRRVSVEEEKTTAEIPPVRKIMKFFVPAAAGYSAPIDGEDYEMIRLGPDAPRNADYAVNIQGNSMAPYICDGDTVYVQRNAEISVGDVGIFCVDGAMYCKIFYKNREGVVTLVSANQALRKTNVRLSPDGDQSFECLGKVLLDERVPMPAYFTE